MLLYLSVLPGSVEDKEGGGGEYQDDGQVELPAGGLAHTAPVVGGCPGEGLSPLLRCLNHQCRAGVGSPSGETLSIEQFLLISYTAYLLLLASLSLSLFILR